MLTKLFSGDPAAALTKTLGKIASIEANIVRLREQRAERLLTTDEPSEVVTLDKAIEAETANLVILGDRCRALREEIRRQEFAARELQRRKSIEKIDAKLKQREVLAARLQSLIE